MLFIKCFVLNSKLKTMVWNQPLNSSIQQAMRFPCVIQLFCITFISNSSLLLFAEDSQSSFTYFYPRMDLQYFWWSPLTQPLTAHLAILSKTLHPGSDHRCYVMSTVTPFNLPVPATTQVQLCYVCLQEVTKKQFQWYPSVTNSFGRLIYHAVSLNHPQNSL
jgi:hypothetical protein